MNGKELLESMNYVNAMYIEEAETATFQASESHRPLKRPLLIAAIVALMLMLVGCAVVYVLKMQDLKIADTKETVPVFATDGQSVVGYEVEDYEVLTLAGLKGSPGYQAAMEWYEFESNYDTDYKIWEANYNSGLNFPEEYKTYVLYSQEMKDTLDAILKKYNLKTVGAPLDFRNMQNMCQALGIEKILTTDNGVTIRSESGGCHENGNFWLNMDIQLPEDPESERTDAFAVLHWNRKDCFSDSLFVTKKTNDWQEWNYTTSSGRNVLILRSPSDWRGWIICEREEALMALQIEARRDLGYNVDGKSWWDHVYMTDRQLELVADAIDFSIQPKIATHENVANQPGISGDNTHDGYTITLKDVVTDGHWAEITLGITAPTGTILAPEDTSDQWSYFHTANHGSMMPADGRDIISSSTPANLREDGDGLSNTMDYVFEASACMDDGSEPFVPGSVWYIYLEDLIRTTFTTGTGTQTDEVLAEGEWEFTITIGEADGTFDAIEFVTEPVPVEAEVAMAMDGKDVYEDVMVTSFVLRTNSATISHNLSFAPTFGSNHNYDIFVVLSDGSRILLFSDSAFPGTAELTAERPIDLSKVDHILFPDGTILPMPGAEPLICDEPAVPSTETEGVELLSQPMDYNSLAGYVEGADGVREDLYETFHLTSIRLSPSGLTIQGTWAFNGPDVKMHVIMQDGTQVTLTGSGEPLTEAMSVLTADALIDLRNADYVLLPDGTRLNVPQ